MNFIDLPQFDIAQLMFEYDRYSNGDFLRIHLLLFEH